jgi:hypothetical protein
MPPRAHDGQVGVETGRRLEEGRSGSAKEGDRLDGPAIGAKGRGRRRHALVRPGQRSVIQVARRDGVPERRSRMQVRRLDDPDHPQRRPDRPAQRTRQGDRLVGTGGTVVRDEHPHHGLRCTVDAPAPATVRDTDASACVREQPVGPAPATRLEPLALAPWIHEREAASWPRITRHPVMTTVSGF